MGQAELGEGRRDSGRGEQVGRSGLLRVPGEGALLSLPGVEHLFLLTAPDTDTLAGFRARHRTRPHPLPHAGA